MGYFGMIIIKQKNKINQYEVWVFLRGAADKLLKYSGTLPIYPWG
jgi:hypothetical protein